MEAKWKVLGEDRWREKHCFIITKSDWLCIGQSAPPIVTIFDNRSLNINLPFPDSSTIVDILPPHHPGEYHMPRLRPQLPRGAKPATPSLIAQLARRLPANTTILSGAGISTESGLSDYRSPGKPPSRTPTSHNDYVNDPRVRQTYWARSYVGYPILSHARPNPAHRAISALYKSGYNHITQNVDALAPGLMLHGTIHTVTCLNCHAKESRKLFQTRLREANLNWSVDAVRIRPDGDADLSDGLLGAFNVPTCRVCTADALMPHLVFHGGTVPREVTAQATRIIDASDALLIVGSTVTPYSAFRLVRRARENGAYVACINFGNTRADDLYDDKIEGLVGDAMARLARELVGLELSYDSVHGEGCLQL